MKQALREALHQVANYLWKLQSDINEDAGEYRIEEALDWARHALEVGGLPVNDLGKRILRGMVEWRDFYPQGMDGFDEEHVYPIVVKTLMPRLLAEEKDVLNGGDGPELTFYIALDSIVQNMQVRGPLTMETSYGRLTRAEILLQTEMENWAFEMWSECQRLLHKET
jgi:hypothetical protein